LVPNSLGDNLKKLSDMMREKRERDLQLRFRIGGGPRGKKETSGECRMEGTLKKVKGGSVERDVKGERASRQR